MIQTPLTRLVGCAVPIQSAGMGGIARPALAVAVCEAGGLGMLAGVGASPASLTRLLEMARAGTADVSSAGDDTGGT
jgi:NAD(P)H-dependent flavin oxidoreductase YrpB (nitropropane dioxygenase family)